MARKKLFAAIDVGSHEIQMKIAELEKDEPPRIVEDIRRTLAIGVDTYMSGRISQPLIEECVKVLAGFNEQLKTYRIGACRAVATSAFREAQNRAYALEQIRRQCGLEIEVLSNAEERYCHIMAAAALMPDFGELIKEGTLLVDIGAGSIQVTVYDKGEFIFSQNMLLGSLRIRELLADLERRAADFGELMEEYISSDLDNYHLLEPKGISYKNLIILGGEMNQLKKLAGKDPNQPAFLSEKQFGQLYQQLLNTRPIDLALDKDIPAEHASLMLPSAMIIRKFLSFTRASGLLLPAVSLCDGLLAEFSREKGDFSPSHDQTRDIISACRNLAKRFKTDRKHTDFVEKMTLQLYDETSRLHNLPDRCRLLLQAAAILHDSGKYINMSKHNIRSYNLIMATEIIGLSPLEHDIVAWIARFHSGKPALEDRGYLELDAADQLLIAKLSALLRLGDALDTGHKQKISTLSATLEADELVISVTTSQDITLEIWTIEKKGSLFEDIFGCKPRIRIRRQQK